MEEIEFIMKHNLMDAVFETVSMSSVFFPEMKSYDLHMDEYGDEFLWLECNITQPYEEVKNRNNAFLEWFCGRYPPEVRSKFLFGIDFIKED